MIYHVRRTRFGGGATTTKPGKGSKSDNEVKSALQNGKGFETKEAC
jgi:hypothetical protein